MQKYLSNFIYISRGRFWVFLILAFLLGTTIQCSVTDKKTVTYYKETRTELVVPESKQKEAAELYAKIYTEASKRSAWGEEEAKKAVLTIYGVPKQNP